MRPARTQGPRRPHAQHTQPPRCINRVLPPCTTRLAPSRALDPPAPAPACMSGTGRSFIGTRSSPLCSTNPATHHAPQTNRACGPRLRAPVCVFWGGRGEGPRVQPRDPFGSFAAYRRRERLLACCVSVHHSTHVSPWRARRAAGAGRGRCVRTSPHTPTTHPHTVKDLHAHTHASP